MYGYAAPFYSNPIYYILLVPVLILSVYAQIKVSSTFKRYSKIPDRRGVTGAQAAYEVLRAHGIHDVQIRPCEPVYGAGTVAAVGVAAHEAGHAVQYALGYGPIRIRAFIIPATQFGSQFSFIALMLGWVLYSQPLFALGIVLFSLTSVFQLVTLPVEFNASARALRTIDSSFLLDDSERQGAKKVLTAAALTYVAALLMSLVQLLRYLLMFAQRSDRRR